MGGGILKLLDLDSLTIFIWGGRGILNQVQNKGILKLLDLDSLTIFVSISEFSFTYHKSSNEEL